MTNQKTFEDLKRDFEDSQAQLGELTEALESLNPNLPLDIDPDVLAEIDAACEVEEALTRPVTAAPMLPAFAMRV